MRGVGYFFVHRRLWFSDSASLRDRGEPEARRREAWIWLLAQANWDDADGLRPGQLRTSRGQISAYTGWPDGKVRAWLKCLLKEGAISLERQGNHSIITVENWSNYQQSPRLDLGPSQYQAGSNPAPTQVQPSVSAGQQSLAAGSSLGPSQDQAGSDLGPATLKEERTKNQNQHMPIADGGNGSEDFALDGQSSSPAKATRGVVVNDERWLEKLPRDEKGRPVYPSTFSDLWNIWLSAQKRPGSRTKAADKAQTYRLVREHLKDGIAFSDIVQGTKRYLAINWNQIGCVQPPRFCRRKDPMFLDHLGDTSLGGGSDGNTYSRADFPNLAKLGGYLAIVMRAHNVDGAPGRAVPPDDAWRVFQEQTPEIQAEVKAGCSL